MKSLLEQLENNEAILLMHLAGELPEADRLEVEQMLDRDPALRRELDELRALHQSVGGMLARIDAAPSRQDRVVGRLSKEMAKFATARRELKPAGNGDEHRLRIGPTVWRVALAASLLIGAVGLFWRFARTGPQQPPREQFATPIEATPDRVAMEISPDDLKGEALAADTNPADANLSSIEKEIVKLAIVEEDPLGFRTVRDRQ